MVLELDSNSRQEMLRIIEKLSLSESGGLDYADLVNEFGFDIVRKMISQNLLYYRATKSISGDSNESEPSKLRAAPSCHAANHATEIGFFAWAQRIWRKCRRFGPALRTQPARQIEVRVVEYVSLYIA